MRRLLIAPITEIRCLLLACCFISTCVAPPANGIHDHVRIVLRAKFWPRLPTNGRCLLIDALEGGSVRSALIRRVVGITQKMLTETLRHLKSLNTVTRRSRESVRCIWTTS